MKKNQRYTIGIPISLLILAAFFGVVIFYDKQTAAQSDTPELLVVEQETVGSNILALLEDLKKIKLDDSIFSEQIFKDLQDFSVIIPAEIKGRNNPFDPIGIDSAQFFNSGAGAETSSNTAAPAQNAPRAPRVGAG